MRKPFRAAAAAAALVVAALSGQPTAVAGSPFAIVPSDTCKLTPVTVAAVDAYGRPVPGAEVALGNAFPPSDACGVPGSAELNANGVTGPDGTWTGRIPLVVPDPGATFGLATNGISWDVQGQVRRPDGVAESVDYQTVEADVVDVVAKDGVVTVSGGSAVVLRAFMPVIEGSGVIRTGQVATFTVRLPAGLPGTPEITWDAASPDGASFGAPPATQMPRGATTLDSSGHAAGAVLSVEASRPGHVYLTATVAIPPVSPHTPSLTSGALGGWTARAELEVAILPPAPPSIALDGPHELTVGAKGTYLARPAHTTGPVSWTIDGREYGRLSPAGLQAVLVAQKPGYVTITVAAAGEGGQVARATERVRIVAPPGPPTWEILLPLLAILLLLLLILAARRRRRGRENEGGAP